MALTFCDPYPFFRVFGEFLGPVAWIRYLVVPFAVFAGLICVSEWYELMAQLTRIAFTFSFLQAFLISIIFVNLLTKIMTGTAMARHAAASRQFGMRLKFGIILKFFVDRSPTRDLSLSERVKVDSVPLLSKLLVFASSITFWAIERRTGSSLTDFALTVGVHSFSSFLFTANPLWPADGYRVMSAKFGRPNLRKESLLVFSMLIRRRPLPAALSRKDLWIYFLFGLAVVVFTSVLLFLIFSGLLLALERDYSGVGILYFCLILAMIGLFFLSMRQSRMAMSKARLERRRNQKQASSLEPGGPALHPGH